MNNKRFLIPVGIGLLLFGFILVCQFAFGFLTNPPTKGIYPPANGEVVTFDSIPDQNGKTIKVSAYWLPVEDSEWTLILIGGYRLHSSNPFMINKQQTPISNMGYSTLLLDLPDTGGPTTGDGHINFGLEEQLAIRAAKNWLFQNGYDKVGFVTHSMGSYATLLASTFDPEINMIVADSPLTKLSANIDYRISKGQMINAAYPLAFFYGKFFMGEDLYAVNVDNLELHSNLNLLISVCEGDPAVDPQQGRDLAKRFVSSRLIELQHQEIHPCMPYDHNQEWLENIREFFPQ